MSQRIPSHLIRHIDPMTFTGKLSFTQNSSRDPDVLYKPRYQADGLDGNELFTPRTVGFEEEHIVQTQPNNNRFANSHIYFWLVLGMKYHSFYQARGLTFDKVLDTASRIQALKRDTLEISPLSGFWNRGEA